MFEAALAEVIEHEGWDVKFSVESKSSSART
jgi:hypothetical protein